jgi:hypothetical protein
VSFFNGTLIRGRYTIFGKKEDFMAVRIQPRDPHAHLQELIEFGGNKKIQVEAQTDSTVQYNIQFLWNQFKTNFETGQSIPSWMDFESNDSGRLVSPHQQVRQRPVGTPSLIQRIVDFLKKIFGSAKNWVVSFVRKPRPLSNRERTAIAVEKALSVDGLKYLFYSSIVPQITEKLSLELNMAALEGSDGGTFLHFLHRIDKTCLGRWWNERQHRENVEIPYAEAMSIDELYGRYISKADGNLYPIWVCEKDGSVDNLYPQL